MATRIHTTTRHERFTQFGDWLVDIEDWAITALAILATICLLSAGLFTAIYYLRGGR
jgi:hypothetical protein